MIRGRYGSQKTRRHFDARVTVLLPNASHKLNFVFLFSKVGLSLIDYRSYVHLRTFDHANIYDKIRC